VFIAVGSLRYAKLGTIAPPNQYREKLTRVRFIKVQEGGATPTRRRKVRTRYESADRSIFPYMFTCLCWGERMRAL